MFVFKSAVPGFPGVLYHQGPLFLCTLMPSLEADAVYRPRMDVEGTIRAAEGGLSTPQGMIGRELPCVWMLVLCCWLAKWQNL